jgi:hypothetical protein
MNDTIPCHIHIAKGYCGKPGSGVGKDLQELFRCLAKNLNVTYDGILCEFIQKSSSLVVDIALDSQTHFLHVMHVFARSAASQTGAASESTLSRNRG